MAQIECGRGHLYDPDKYPTCPYCNTNQQITVAAAGRTAPIRVTGTNRTAPVSVTAPQRTAPLSGVSVTAPQKTAPLSGISVTAPSKTMPPRGYNPNGAPVQPEEAPAPAFPHGASVTSAGKTVGMMQEKMGFDPVVGWLVSYTTGFMLTRRSRELGTYLLIGLEPRQVARLFFLENLAVGAVALALGFNPEGGSRNFAFSTRDTHSGLHNYLRVDVKNPQFKVIVEIRDYGAYIHGPKIQGEGGLPVGTSGRALNMLSGGIDSPVAAYRMAKRGLALDHIHFASPPYTSERAKLKVKALAQLITVYTGSANLFVVPYTKPQEYIRDNAPDVLFTVLMRRSMMRIANVIAKKQGCEALVTGESLAQVASQTVKALQCTDAAQDLPILRPLIGMDKTEIIETSRHINTFETSILPYEDCCTIFTPPHPKIRPELEEILAAEAAMPGLAALEAEAAEQTERIRVRITDQVEFEG